VLLRLRASAKVLGSEEIDCSVVSGVALSESLPKGLVGTGVGSAVGDWDDDGFEKGFRLEGVLENGFPEADDAARVFTPKSDSPKPVDIRGA
jgi:hypothetical protein